MDKRSLFKIALLGGEHVTSYSRSPQVHKSSAELLGFSCEFTFFGLSTDRASEIPHILEQFRLQGGIGVNITSPWKEKVAQLIPDPKGKHLSSVNTLALRTDLQGRPRWTAFATDGPGLDQAIWRMWGVERKQFLDLVILGNGGAVRGLKEWWQMSSPQWQARIQILDRTHIAQLGDILSCTRDALLIQATSAPHKGQPLSSLCSALKPELKGVVDLTYNPCSDLVKAALSLGIPSMDGFPMLLAQAWLSQTLWWGRAPSCEHWKRCLRELTGTVDATEGKSDNSDLFPLAPPRHSYAGNHP